MTLKWANVDALLRSLTAKQFAGWEHFAQLEPFGELRADYHAAQIAQMVFNMAVAVKDRLPMEEFLLKFKDSEEAVKKAPQTFEEQIAIAKIMVMAANAGALDKES